MKNQKVGRSSKILNLFQKQNSRLNLLTTSDTLVVDIPDDIFLEFCGYLSSSDVLQMSLTSRHVRQLLLPLIYASVDLFSTELCRSVLNLLAQRPILAHYIKKLTVRPNHPSGWANRSDKSIDEAWVAAIIEHIASKGHLLTMTTFLWDGLEAPNDRLWSTLRFSCPNITDIGTSVGPAAQNFSAESQLFKFQNLTGFTLKTQKIQRWSDFRPRQELPSTFWDMLLAQSPNLQELTLDATCRLSELWALRKVLSGRWPQLQKLCVGVLSALYDGDDDDSDVVAFLVAHQNLHTVYTLGTTSYSRDTMDVLTSLPRLRILSTKLQRLSRPSPLCSICTLHLRDWLSPSARFSEILSSLPSITEITCCVNFVDALGKQQDFFDRLLSACPQLLNVHVLSTSSLSLLDWSRSLLQAEHLVSFEITRSCRSSEDTTSLAVRIAQTHPSLKHFTFRDVAASADREDLINGMWKTRQLNCYTITLSSSGGYFLRCRESSVNSLGSRHSKTFIRNISVNPPQGKSSASVYSTEAFELRNA